MIGITRVSRESIFSDFNNPEIVTTTSKKYEECFGFTEEEVFTALEEYGLSQAIIMIFSRLCWQRVCRRIGFAAMALPLRVRPSSYGVHRIPDGSRGLLPPDQVIL